MRYGKRRLHSARFYFGVLALAFFIATPSQMAWAGVARFVAGIGWGNWPGNNVAWNTSTLLYFTDAGPLSTNVSKQQADALVAAAAAVWNVPTSSISLAQGGTLAEDVSSLNVVFDGQSFAFPADVQISNENAVPVAVVYDVDGSLIDLLLGEGASEPDGCNQNAVIGDVDDIHPDDAALHHATLILNGRCVGSYPEQLMQMQYQLARAFGRVLGVSWSQTNDNVFTAQTTVTANQMAYWPLMHPIDVICGNYTYQCMSNPFTLRPDDLNTLAGLYPVYQGAVPPGKQGTSNDALYIRGSLYFPTGQQMDWVNITTRRSNGGVSEDWQTVSNVTGSSFQQQVPTPISSPNATSTGTNDPNYEGFFLFRRIPLNGSSDVYFVTEPINPLYTGDAAIGTYLRPPATPAGSPVVTVDWSALSAGDLFVTTSMTASDAASGTCNGQDGTEETPASPDPSGWQSGLLCSWSHSSWWTLPVAAGHTWTLEVTATDETGSASANKAQPVLGVWNGDDPAGVPPTVASQPVSFNSMSLGMTQLQMNAPDADQSFRLSISDQFGAGRPDFTYVARVLYVATVTPSTVGAGGGRITINGTGFRQGNQVLVNGAPAQVLSWTATQILAEAPTSSAAGSAIGVPVTVSVLDTETAGSATIPAALSYTAAPELLQQVSAPSALQTGVVAPVPFAVRVLTSDGSSPVPNASVGLSVTAGSAQLGICQGESFCTATTDANGIVETSITGGAAGTVTLLATEVSGGASVQLDLVTVAPVRLASFTEPDRYLAAGASGTWSLHLLASQDGSPAAGIPVTWATAVPLLEQAPDSTTDANGTAQIRVSALALDSGGAETVTGCVWTSICATWTLHSVPASEWIVQPVGNTAQHVPSTSTLEPVTLIVTDGLGHAVQGAQIDIYQRVLGWEGACASDERCPSAPVLTTSETNLTSNEQGLITITPLQIQGIPEVVEIAASGGAYGFATLTLVKSPGN